MENQADIAFRNPSLMTDSEIDAAQHTAQQTFLPIHNKNLVDNFSVFPELYGGDPAPEPEIIHLEPKTQAPLFARMVSAVCRQLIRATKVQHPKIS
ncbi:MAG TPA: hypothetical protein VLF90_02920 [Patescibacteria group bacterium]|nr:hypothetical protein [Patescibacteria group bacterium]